MYQIIWSKMSSENLDNLEHQIAARIVKKVKELSENPFSKEIKRLKGIAGYRLRVGDYRVIFDIEGDKILILKVGHRKNIYDR